MITYITLYLLIILNINIIISYYALCKEIYTDKDGQCNSQVCTLDINIKHRDQKSMIDLIDSRY